MIVHITWEILWMQISDVILLQLHEEHNSVMKENYGGGDY
jgi:hypothetical protein